MWPLVSDLVFMCSFHNVFLDALRHAVDPMLDQPDDNAELPDMSESEMLGLPSTDPSKWHKQERRRALKALRWLESVGTLQSMVLFLHSAQPVMRLHFTLFKHAQQSPSPGDNERSLIFNFCTPSKSIPIEVIASLSRLITSTEPWTILENMIGAPVSQWPADFKRQTRNAVLSLIAQVWRRLVECYRVWPWLLVPLADPDTDLVTKVRIANALFDCPMEGPL